MKRIRILRRPYPRYSGAEAMDERDELLRHALGYPYRIPATSYALLGGEATDLDAVEGIDLSARVALLAYGSNASPAVLARKLAAAPDPVPVVRTVLRDFDVVYSAHVSRYGAVPATLAPSPGTEAPAFVAHLTAAQLELVSATEPNYDLASFDRPSCTLERGDAPAALEVYLSRHGPLRVDDREVALAAIGAGERRLPELDQRRVLELARDALCPDRSLEDFVALSCARPWPSIPPLRSSSSTRARNSPR